MRIGSWPSHLIRPAKPKEFDSYISPWLSFSPGCLSSSPVEIIATFSFFTTATDLCPIVAQRPTLDGVR